MSKLVDRFFQNRSDQFRIILIISSILLFSSLSKGGLSGYDDAFYAHYGKQMILTGDWWSLRLNGNHNFEFPPMFPWLEALSMKAFGITDFAAKFPAALLGLLTIVLTYGVAKELFDDFWIPTLAMAVMGSTQYFIKYAMHSMTDVPFTFFFMLSVYFYLIGIKRHDYFWLAGMAIGAAILTRSVFGLLPLGIIFLHLLATGKLSLIRSKDVIGMVMLSLALPMVWYSSQYRLHGRQFLDGHFSFIASKVRNPAPVAGDEKLPAEEIVCRTTEAQRSLIASTLDAPERSDENQSSRRRMEGLIEYPKLLMHYYWPWLPLMLIGLVGQISAWVRAGDHRAALLVIWVAGVLVPLSIPEAKVLRYIMPVFPAFAILSAMALNRWATAATFVRCLKLGYLIVLTVLLLAALFPKPRLRAEEMRALAPIAEANSNPAQRVLLYTYGELRHNYLSQFVWYADRYCDYLTSLDSLKDTLGSRQGLVAIIDKEAFRRISGDLGQRLVVLGESGGFVCVK